MKSKKLISVTFIILVFCFSAFARGTGPSQQDIQQFKAKKIAFITDKLQLTPQEAQKFWPVYNQYDKENWEIQNKRRELGRKSHTVDSLSDKEVVELTREMAASYKQEAVLKQNYNEKFLKILPPKKVLKLYQAEQQFTMQMLRDFRSRFRDRDHR